MKQIILPAFIACLLLGCNNADNKNETTTTADTTGTVSTTIDTPAVNATDTGVMIASSRTVTDKNVINFVHAAVKGGAMEVQMGNMAREKATNERVKNFGAMMVTDHSAANEELKHLADAANIVLPAETGNDMKVLHSKKGPDFDKTYVKMMVADHKEDIEEFKRAGNNLKDTVFKSFALRTLPVLQKHLDSIQQISKSIK